LIGEAQQFASRARDGNKSGPLSQTRVEWPFRSEKDVPMSCRKRTDPLPSIREAARQVTAVTLASFTVAAAAQAAPPRERLTAESVFIRADINHDGRPSKAEVARFPVFTDKFDELDVDHDGSLSLSEFEAGFYAPQ